MRRCHVGDAVQEFRPGTCHAGVPRVGVDKVHSAHRARHRQVRRKHVQHGIVVDKAWIALGVRSRTAARGAEAVDADIDRAGGKRCGQELDVDAASAVHLRREFPGEQPDAESVRLEFVHGMSIIGRMATATSADLRRVNVARALRAIHRSGGEISRSQLARELQCTRATAAALVRDLSAMELASERPAPATGRRGRPTTTLVPAGAGPVVVALEAGIEQVRLATVTIGGVLTDAIDVPVPDPSVAAVRKTGRRLLTRRLKELDRRCVGVGVAAYGPVEASTGVLLEAPHLGWRDVDMKALLTIPSGLAFTVDNVANLIALADSVRGIGRGHRTVLYIHAGIGVGGTLVHEGVPVRGRIGIAGEYGHLPFGLDGLACRCGATGCWETEVDQRALVRLAGKRGAGIGLNAAARAVFDDAGLGRAKAVRAVQRTAARFGRGLAALIAVHDPDAVVLAGHAADLLEHAPEAVGSALQEHVLAPYRRDLPLVRSTPLGNDAALIGAAEQLFTTLLSDPVPGRQLPVTRQ